MFPRLRMLTVADAGDAVSAEDLPAIDWRRRHNRLRRRLERSVSPHAIAIGVGELDFDTATSKISPSSPRLHWQLHAERTRRAPPSLSQYSRRGGSQRVDEVSDLARQLSYSLKLTVLRKPFLRTGATRPPAIAFSPTTSADTWRTWPTSTCASSCLASTRASTVANSVNGKKADNCAGAQRPGSRALVDGLFRGVVSITATASRLVPLLGAGPFRKRWAGGLVQFSSLEIEMASTDTGKLKVNVIVTGFSVPTNPERWVRLRIAASNGRSVERVFSYLGLNNDPRPLIGAASAIGIPLIRSGAKQEFMALVEAALSKADQSAADPPPAFEPVTQVGWHRNVFVTPRTFYPYPQNSLELCLGEVRGSLCYERKGSLGQWNRAFRWSLQRNPYLLFAASLSLAPCLLKFANLEGCIISLVGPTSCGKTTLLDLSGSARGGVPSKKLGFKDFWGTTPNALEQLAIQANDTLLILDDIQNAPGSIYQRAALLDYAAFNLPSGREKDRMT